MLSILTVCSCLLSLGDVTARPLQGEPVRGVLVELSESKVTIQTSDGRRSFDTRALQSIQSQPSANRTAEAAPSVWVELVDGSNFPGVACTASQGKATMRAMTGSNIVVPTDLVRSVRFHRQDEAVKKQWSSIAGEQHVADVLVVRKLNPAGTGGAAVVLDQLSGVVHEVRENTVVFEFDGDRLEAARAKIEGIIYRPLPAAELPDPACRVRATDGSIWNAKTISLQQDRLKLVTVAGASVEIGLGRVVEIDFSAANLVYLADLEPESVEWRPYFQSRTTPRSLTKWFEPKVAPLILNGESYNKGLALHSRTSVTYRLTRDYRQFVSVVGIDERYRDMANLSLSVIGDGRSLWTRTLKDVTEPLAIELNIEGVRRLKILVDFGEDHSDAGDLLYLGDPRLVK